VANGLDNSDIEYASTSNHFFKIHFCSFSEVVNNLENRIYPKPNGQIQNTEKRTILNNGANTKGEWENGKIGENGKLSFAKDDVYKGEIFSGIHQVEKQPGAGFLGTKESQIPHQQELNKHISSNVDMQADSWKDDDLLSSEEESREDEEEFEEIQPGVNIANILCAVFTLVGPKVQNNTADLTVFFVYSVSARIKAACRTLMKLTQGVNFTNVLRAAVAH